MSDQEPTDDSQYSGPSIGDDHRRRRAELHSWGVQKPSEKNPAAEILGGSTSSKPVNPYMESTADVYICDNDKCRKAHLIGDSTFFTFVGNVNVGIGGGIIGNNLKDVAGHTVVQRVTVYCFDCALTYLRDCADKARGRKER